jgi:hypothetical protein
MSKHAKSEQVSARVSPEAKIELVKLAAALDLTASELVRELVTGYVDGRVTIIPPKQPMEKLYNARTED